MSRARCCLRYSRDQNFATENAAIAVLLGQNVDNENSSRCFPNVFVRRNQKYIAIKSTTQNVHSWRPCCLEDNRLPDYHDSLRAANQLGIGLFTTLFYSKLSAIRVNELGFI